MNYKLQILFCPCLVIKSNLLIKSFFFLVWDNKILFNIVIWNPFVWNWMFLNVPRCFASTVCFSPWSYGVVHSCFMCSVDVINVSSAYWAARNTKIKPSRACFCPLVLQDTINYSFFSPFQRMAVKEHYPDTMCCPALLLMAAARDSSAYIRLLRSALGSICLCSYDRLKDEIGCGDHLWLNAASLLHLLLRDVSLKLWPNRCVLRTLGSSSPAAASSFVEIKRVSPEFEKGSFQQKGLNFELWYHFF